MFHSKKVFLQYLRDNTKMITIKLRMSMIAFLLLLTRILKCLPVWYLKICMVINQLLLKVKYKLRRLKYVNFYDFHNFSIAKCLKCNIF